LQRAAAHFLHRGKLKAHLERVNVKYRERRDELLRVMAQKMPAYARWTKPKGGFCTWVTLPSDCVPRDLHHLALTHGVAYTPGESFLTEPDGFVHLRLCFGGLSPELIRESVTILARLLDPTLARPPSRLRTSGDERPIV
jgi:DNA-binding transcriptional MocR family regulator